MARSTHFISALLILCMAFGMVVLASLTQPDQLANWHWWAVLALLAVLTFAGFDELLMAFQHRHRL